MNPFHSSKICWALLGFILAGLTCLSQSEAASFQGLGDLPGGLFGSEAFDVSADGRVVVGGSQSDLVQEAFRWENGIMTGLGSSPSGGASIANGISADGSVVVGESGIFSSSFEAWRWENGIMTGLGDLPGGGFFSRAYDVSADGLVVVGSGESDLGEEAFRWENDTMVGLGGLMDPWDDITLESRAYGVSADGSVVVGESFYGSGSLSNFAFIWTEEDGMLYLQELLETNYGLDLTGWTLKSAQGVSDDGLTIVGYGFNPDMRMEGWIAVIPEPATVLLLGLGSLALRFFSRK